VSCRGWHASEMWRNPIKVVVSIFEQTAESLRRNLIRRCPPELLIGKPQKAGFSMSTPSKRQILVVDDEPTVRESLALLLSAAGYDVATAANGFSALLQLRRSLPEVILSDLNMPQMSGFEFLSVVRRRFPDILVIAMSGAYGGGENVPGGVIADAFYAKGQMNPPALLRTVSDLLQNSTSRANGHHQESAPVWIPRNGKDTNGVPYIVLTCTECLRSFPLNVAEDINPEIVETPCIFCLNKVRYVIDFSLSVASPAKNDPETAKDFSATAAA
jgi:CheY-like chemotaxis protein